MNKPSAAMAGGFSGLVQADEEGLVTEGAVEAAAATEGLLGVAAMLTVDDWLTAGAVLCPHAARTSGAKKANAAANLSFMSVPVGMQTKGGCRKQSLCLWERNDASPAALRPER